MHIHTDQRPHACKWAFRGCTARFNDSSNKRAHEKMSCKFMLGKPEKKFVCELCPMKEEVDPVTGEKRMVYSKQYARRIDLIDHQTSKHGGNRNHTRAKSVANSMQTKLMFLGTKRKRM